MPSRGSRIVPFRFQTRQPKARIGIKGLRQGQTIKAPGLIELTRQFVKCRQLDNHVGRRRIPQQCFRPVVGSRKIVQGQAQPDGRKHQIPIIGDFLIQGQQTSLRLAHVAALKQKINQELRMLAIPRPRFATRIQLTTDGHKPYVVAVEDAFGAEIDYAQLVKIYGAQVGPNVSAEVRLQPGSVYGRSQGGHFWQTRSRPYFHQPHRAPELDHADVHAPVH